MNDDTLLARWLAGELSAEELAALEKTPRHATLVRIKENFERINRPPFEGDTMLAAILEHEKNSRKVIPLYRKTWFQSAAASIVLLLGVAFLYTRPEQMETANGKTLAFTLPDNSEVVLNSGSESTYRDWNWDNNRTIELSGEAYFRVAKGKKFSVNTPLGKVTVLGTQFNVKAREGRFDVVCYEGRVLVEYNGKETLLTPQQSLTVEGAIVSNDIIPTDANEPVWLHGEIDFSNAKLSEIIAEIERKYDVDIHTDYRPAATFSGTIPNNNIDGALQKLSQLYRLKVEKKDKTITLKPIDAKR